ncbi:M14 family metallopeptidase [uncultured Herbaspirillum sp.]|uniref:M14 family metallopeptidase n=1 Tax=uncultured Herbaspirillum sp. TaxID=160236 RepID=UPI002588D579|nr:M14 family metallopeptidase [uncultured Herbaspirillum sp.]
MSEMTLSSEDMIEASYYSSSYAQAREKFLAAVTERGLLVSSFPHPSLKGRDGEELAVDTALWGSFDASRLLIVSSGMHGVEGFSGSACQLSSLNDRDTIKLLSSGQIAILFVHALNPYGFSYYRRGDENNVDLNRNFCDDGAPPCNDDYRALHPHIVPDHWPPTEEAEAGIRQFIEAKGMQRFQTAVSGGQFEFPDGLFFGGDSPSWSNRTLRHILRTYGERRKMVVWVDLHSGLGPYAAAEKICSGPNDARLLALARKWWGEDVTSTHEGSSASTILTGSKWRAFEKECGSAWRLCLTVEFGIFPAMQALRSLRAEQFLYNHKTKVPEAQKLRIQKDFLDTFLSGAPDWKRLVLGQSNAIIRRSLISMAEQEILGTVP